MQCNQLRIRNTVDAPARARRYVGEVLADVGADVPAEVMGSVALMVSELATNCVRYVDSDITVSVETDDNAIRVDVADDGAGPVTLPLGDGRPGDGRGLRIVAQLADDWGVCECDDGDGKSVWFTLNV